MASAPDDLGDPRADDLESPRRRAIRRFFSNPTSVIGTVLVVTFVTLAIFAPVFAPLSPTQIDLNAIGKPPSLDHWLGTDKLGRDVWSRVVYGGRTSLAVGFGAVTIAVLIGTVLGTLAGYFGGWVDQTLMRFTDTIMSVPPLLMVIVFVSAVGPSLGAVIAVIALLTWPGTARLVRSLILTLREREFVVSARVLGVDDRSIVIRHLLPNVYGSLSVVATFGVASAILLEAALGFLGLSVPPPTPSWGEMINTAQSSNVLVNLPWLWLSPGFAIALAVLAVTFVGDGLRDVLDPRTGIRK